jgi:hypothetical protein
MMAQEGELLFSVHKLSSGHYVASRDEPPVFRVEGKTISEVSEKAIKIFLWKDDDGS